MKFSIITPTYNRAHTLERAIKSILNQTHQDYEMIIVDDGSIDNTFDIIQKYLHDIRIRYIGPNENGGVNVARNIGLESVSEDCDWITFLDSDDEFYPDSLEKMKTSIENNPKYHYFRFAVTYANGKPACFAKHDNLVLNYKETLKQEEVSGEWVVALSKNILEDGFRFIEDVNGFESISWYQLSKKELCFHSFQKVRIYHLDTEGLQRQSIKTDKYYANQIKGINIFLNFHKKALKRFNNKDYATKLYILSNANFRLGNYKSGLINLGKALVIDPLNSNVSKKLLKFK